MIVLVATIGVAQLAQAIVFTFPDLPPAQAARYPLAVGRVWEDVAGIRITGAELTVLIIVPLLSLALGWFLNRTTFGRTVKASADNPDLARLSGISPKKVSTFVWIVAGLLASISLILLSGLAGSPTGIDTLGPATLNRALAAAVIAGMASFPRALLAGVAIGVVEAVIRFNFFDQAGLIDFLLFVAVIVAVFLQTRSEEVEASTYSFAPRVHAVPERLRSIWWVRHLGLLVGGLTVAVAAIVPLIVTEPSRHLLYTQILLFAIAALSLVVVTGWSGQLSLGQMAFAGIGALFAAACRRGIAVDIGWHDLRIIDAGVEPLPWGISLLAGAAFAALAAVVVGLGALRVRGLLLAVSTFAFAVATQQYLYRRPFFSNGNSASVPFERGSILGVDFTSQRAFYWLSLAALVIVVVVVARLRRTGVGRTTIAVRDNPDAAAAYTVGGGRTKLTAFALAGGLAGLAGGLMAGAIENVPLTERIFQVEDSLRLVSIVVIGGLSSVAGPILGALWVVGLPAVFPDNNADATVHLQHRAAPAPPLLPRWAGADRLQRPRRARPLAGCPLAGGHRQADAHTTGVPRAHGPRPGRRRGARTRRRRRERALRRHRRRRRGQPDRRGQRGRRPDRDQRRRQVHAAQRHRRLRALSGPGPPARVRHHPKGCCGTGPSGTGPHVPGRDALPRAHRAGDRAGGAGGPGPHALRGQRRHPPLLPPPGAGPRRRSRRADRLPRPRPLRRRVHRRPVDGHPSHRGARRAARPRRPGPLPGRTHGGRRPARDRGLRVRSSWRSAGSWARRWS